MRSNRGHTTVSTEQIIEQFLHDNGHIAFVMLLTVREEQKSWMQRSNEELRIEYRIWLRPDVPPQLGSLLSELGNELPAPVNTSINAAYRAVEDGFGHGHGTMSMTSRGVKIGARHLMEVLAGRRSVEDFNRNFSFRNRDEPADGRRMPNPFEQALNEGRLPIHISIEETGENGRDNVLWIEFGDPDSAISLFR